MLNNNEYIDRYNKTYMHNVNIHRTSIYVNFS